MIKISPSILAADFSKMGQEVASLEQNGADWVHIDVMDGSYVPNITLGFDMVAAIKKSCSLFLDVHLMMVQPERYFDRFVKAGANMLTFHPDSTSLSPEEVIDQIHALGCKAGLALNPDQSIEMIRPYIPLADMILIMTVRPGFGGQKYMLETEEKMTAVRGIIADSGKEIDLEVDGGINAETSKRAVAAGANVLVAGSAVFGAKDRREAILNLRV